VLSLTYPVEELSRRLGDFYFRLRGPQPTSEQVALLVIDDASISRYGRWPWSRMLLARLVRAASAHGPRALGLDIIFSEPQDELADRDLAEALGSASNVVLATKIAALPEHSVWVDPLPLFVERTAGIGHVHAVLGRMASAAACRHAKLRLRDHAVRWPWRWSAWHAAQSPKMFPIDGQRATWRRPASRAWIK
jgi:CHASE2 domain-containing sensor protein